MIYCVASIIYRNLTLENISGSTDKIAIVSVIMHNIKIFALTYIGIYCAYLLSYFKYDTSVNKGIALYIKGIIAITIITVILSTVKNISVYKKLRQGVEKRHRTAVQVPCRLYNRQACERRTLLLRGRIRL